MSFPRGALGIPCSLGFGLGGLADGLGLEGVGLTVVGMVGRSIDTKLIHAGEPRERVLGSVSMPIFQSSTFESRPGDADYHDIRYLRLSNSPNHVALHEKLAAIEGAEAALVTASGMAAISTTLLSLLKPGDHLIAQDGLYGGTHDLLTKDLAELGIEASFFDGRQPEQLAALRRPSTKLVYCEAITNPLVAVAALPEIVAFAKQHELTSLIDSTFATPVNFRPAEIGFDGVLHSATKYLNGHSDIVAGALMGRAELVATVKRKLDHLGGSLDPHACFLLHRGLKTLAVRMRHHNASALEVAKFFATHNAVSAVHYPGLETHPDARRAAGLMSGFGGMLSFELKGGTAAADAFVARSKLGVNAPSLGGPETLLTRPALTSHLGMSPEAREAIGVSDGLVRVSVGLESAGDLIADFRAALD